MASFLLFLFLGLIRSASTAHDDVLHFAPDRDDCRGMHIVDVSRTWPPDVLRLHRSRGDGGIAKRWHAQFDAHVRHAQLPTLLVNLPPGRDNDWLVSERAVCRSGQRFAQKYGTAKIVIRDPHYTARSGAGDLRGTLGEATLAAYVNNTIAHADAGLLFDTSHSDFGLLPKVFRGGDFRIPSVAGGSLTGTFYDPVVSIGKPKQGLSFHKHQPVQ